MNVTDIPFHQYLGLELAEPPYLLQLKTAQQHANHLGTIHASVLIALAEAGSGLFLMNHLGRPHGAREEKLPVQHDSASWQAADHHAEQYDYHDVFPVIRRIDAKFHQGGQGTVFARCTLDPSELSNVHADLLTKHRAKALVPMQVVDVQGTLLLSVSFEWFIQRRSLSVAH